MMQFLIEHKDKSLCIIHQKSIIAENAAAALSIGELVKFLWPEDNPKAKEYTGTIVAKDCNKDFLLIQRGNRLTTDKNFNTEVLEKREKIPPSLIQKEISKETLKTKVPEDDNYASLLRQEMQNFKNETLAAISCAKKEIISKINSSLENNEKLETKKRSRNYGFSDNNEETIPSTKNIDEIHDENILNTHDLQEDSLQRKLTELSRKKYSRVIYSYGTVFNSSDLPQLKENGVKIRKHIEDFKDAKPHTNKGSQTCVFDDCDSNQDTSKVDISKPDNTCTLRHKVEKGEVNNYKNHMIKFLIFQMSILLFMLISTVISIGKI